ncbi:MAG TPA: hypothetical protein VGL21_09115 [Jatrophihabitantaceae bacterium]|jgi:hypothetical protein
MDVRRRRQLRSGVCFGISALALALCTALGLSATAAAHAASATSGKTGHAALAPAPHRPLAAISRMQDPIGFDVVVAEHTVLASHTADAATASAPVPAARIEQLAEHNRGPPGGKQV